ncbi:MAG: glycoside hydrolase family 38 C-terminal domain-containing protein [Armatimonadota bacterium]
MPDKYYLCSETHWDREWYGEFQQFRMRLVRLMDKLLDIFENDPDYKCFNLDGQTIVLEDYLEIKPEREAEIRKRIGEGKLVVGPWYILPDEFLVTGESTVRNLEFGSRVANKFGKPSKAGYLPDTFGHFSQIPQILRQWGIDNAILWRGISGDEYKNELIWESPDGSSVLLSHIHEKYGYCTAALFVDSIPAYIKEKFIDSGARSGQVSTGDMAVEALIAACAEIKEKAATGCHILFNGVDHMEANPEIPSLIKKANKKLKGGEIVHASFDEYVEALRAAVKGKDLQVVRGELRDTVWSETGTGIILNGVLSSRIYLKQQNQECCTLLENWVEPFSVFNSLLGGSYEKGLIEQAWRWVLKNHPHDSIGGCSIDTVHRQMETRFEWAKDIADNLLQFVFTDILDNVKIDGLAEDEYAFAVFNPSQEQRSDWMDVEVEIPFSAKNWPKESDFRGILVTDMDGNRQKSWLKGFEDKVVNRPSLRKFCTADCRPVFNFSFWAQDIPACGYKVFKFKPLDKPNCLYGELCPERNVMENEYLRVEIKPNGTLCLKDKSTGHVYENLHYFEDGGDNGGGYAYSFPKSDEVYTTLSNNAEISMIENSQARAAYKVRVTMDLPESLDGSNQARSAARKPMVIESVVSLGAGSRRVDIETSLVNTISDHRLRAVFPSYLDADVSSGEAQFDVVDHPVFIKQPSLDIWKEDQPKQFAQKSFSSVSDGTNGLTIANIGLPEYEVTPDTERAIAITLMRSVGYLSTGYKNTRQGPAGPVIATPEAQMLGRKMVFNYSIIPHALTWHESHAQREAHAFVQGLKAMPVLYTSESAKLPVQLSFVSVESDNVMLSSVKRCEDGNGFALRLWNGTEAPAKARVSLFKAPSKVCISNLREDCVEELASSDKLTVDVPAKKIQTFRLSD